MGMCAEIFAVGPFTKDIIEILEYPDKFYTNTDEGTIITEELFGIMEGSNLSKEFAKLFGITDPWDFNQHKINNENIDFKGLKEFVTIYNDYDEDYYKLIKLVENKFELHFRPQG